MPTGEVTQHCYGNQSTQNLIKCLHLTTSLQEIQETEELVKLHRGDENSKVQMRELYRQMTWSLEQINFKGKPKVIEEFAD